MNATLKPASIICVCLSTRARPGARGAGYTTAYDSFNLSCHPLHNRTLLAEPVTGIVSNGAGVQRICTSGNKSLGISFVMVPRTDTPSVKSKPPSGPSM